MNYLAHLWLADQVQAPLAGAILGDFVRGRLLIRGADAGAPSAAAYRDLPADLARSILLHRRIDVCTDRHPRVRAAMAEFEPGARRYAGIVLDLVHDHVLALQWQRFSDESLSDFAARAALKVAEAGAWFERAGSRSPNAWRFKRLLLSYREPPGIARAIRRTAGRLRNPQGLTDAARAWTHQLPAASENLAPLLDDLFREAKCFMLQTPLPAA